tara:strand:+ start:3095 stop:3472 length:378 start_codon:yes stop_codon:yes gene_type:complete
MDYTITIEKIGIILFFIMFIYSGFQKIFNFTQKVARLQSKTGLPSPFNEIGIIGVILLEIIGSILIIYYFFDGEINKELIKKICEVYLLFLIVVTFLYHPPTDKIIPFLSNVTTTGGLLLIYNLI